MSKYVFPVILTPETDGGYYANFPDLESCYTQGDDLPDTLDMAKDVLELTLYGYETKKENIPEPSDIKSFELNQNQIVSLITADTIEYRKLYDNKAVNKTVTLPAWLNTLAEDAGINFSGALQVALKEQLHLIDVK